MTSNRGLHQSADSKPHSTYHCQLPTGITHFVSPTSSSVEPQQHTPTISCSPYVYSPDQSGIPINYQSHHDHRHARLDCVPNYRNVLSVSENDSAVQLSVGTGNPTPLNELHFDLMNIEANMSSSSPMDLGFANIGDEQSLDNIDLNNITPSIKLASAMTFNAPNKLSSDYSEHLGKPLIKNDGTDPIAGHYETSSEMPSTSCPTSNSGARFGTIDLFDVGLAGPSITPRLAGNTSGGSGGSSVTTGNWAGSSLTSPPPSVTGLSGFTGGAVVNDNHRVALIRERSKKDSHNRIERKRRDYINCQITELGMLLPEDMFGEIDSKKNKGSILKNSVEYICTLQKKSQRYADVFNEANLANTVINQMVKRIQDLESLLPPDARTKLLASEGPNDYRTSLREWAKMHDFNQRKMASAASTPSRGVGVGQLSADTSVSSPGMSSIGNYDDIGVFSETRVESPIPIASRPMRSRRNSASSNPGLSSLNRSGGNSVGDTVDNSYLLTPSLFGSLPTQGSRMTSSSSSPLTGRQAPSPHPRSLLPPQTAGAVPTSLPVGKVVRPPATKMEDDGGVARIMFSTGCCGTPAGVFGGLSTSLPVRIASDAFLPISDMDSDEFYHRMVPEVRNTHVCQEGLPVAAFKSHPASRVPLNASTEFHSHSYQPHHVGGDGGGGGGGGGGDGGRLTWSPLHLQPLPTTCQQIQQQAPAESSPARQGSVMSDELQFDPAM